MSSPNNDVSRTSSREVLSKFWQASIHYFPDSRYYCTKLFCAPVEFANLINANIRLIVDICSDIPNVLDKETWIHFPSAKCLVSFNGDPPFITPLPNLLELIKSNEQYVDATQYYMPLVELEFTAWDKVMSFYVKMKNRLTKNLKDHDIAVPDYSKKSAASFTNAAAVHFDDVINFPGRYFGFTLYEQALRYLESRMQLLSDLFVNCSPADKVQYQKKIEKSINGIDLDACLEKFKIDQVINGYWFDSSLPSLSINLRSSAFIYLTPTAVDVVKQIKHWPSKTGDQSTRLRCVFHVDPRVAFPMVSHKYISKLSGFIEFREFDSNVSLKEMKEATDLMALCSHRLTEMNTWLCSGCCGPVKIYAAHFGCSTCGGIAKWKDVTMHCFCEHANKFDKAPQVAPAPPADALKQVNAELLQLKTKLAQTHELFAKLSAALEERADKDSEVKSTTESRAKLEKFSDLDLTQLMCEKIAAQESVILQQKAELERAQKRNKETANMFKDVVSKMKTLDLVVEEF